MLFRVWVGFFFGGEGLWFVCLLGFGLVVNLICLLLPSPIFDNLFQFFISSTRFSSLCCLPTRSTVMFHGGMQDFVFLAPPFPSSGEVRGQISLCFLTHPARRVFICLAGRSIKSNNSKGIKNQSFCYRNKSNPAVFFSEFLKAEIALTNCLSNLKIKSPKARLNFSCQHLDITKVIFPIKPANCWMDKFCTRRGILFSFS